VRIVLRVENKQQQTKTNKNKQQQTTSFMKMSLNFKFLYNYFPPQFFEFSESGDSINANNSVLNVFINK
jgi:hypothetical protein